jgi:uncharacterized protein (TIGR03000 family)
MYKQSYFLAKALIAAAVLVLVTAGPSFAQRGGGRGGGGGGRGGGGGAMVRGGGGAVRGGTWNGGAVRGGTWNNSAWRGGNWAGNNWRGNNWGWNRGWGWGWPAVALWWGGWGGWGGGVPYYWGTDLYASTPYYYADGPDAGYNSMYPPTEAPADNSAMVAVRVPANAEVFFDDFKTSQTGEVRYFNTPPLTPGQVYTYHIRANWMQDGQPVTQTRAVKVEGGKRSAVDFLTTQQ